MPLGESIDEGTIGPATADSTAGSVSGHIRRRPSSRPGQLAIDIRAFSLHVSSSPTVLLQSQRPQWTKRQRPLHHRQRRHRHYTRARPRTTRSASKSPSRQSPELVHISPIHHVIAGARPLSQRPFPLDGAISPAQQQQCDRPAARRSSRSTR